MTENKRFTLEEFGLSFIVNDNGRNLTAKQTVDKLNQLYEENEELKQDKTNLRRAMSRDRVRYLQFRDKVFDLIDEKIKHYEHKPFSAPVGQPMSVNFDADVDRIARLSELQDLKKELQECLMS